MRKAILATLVVAPMILLNGCMDIAGDSDSSSYYTEDNSEFYNGDVLNCDDSNCSVSPIGEGTVIVGEYDADYTKVECEAAGFFYCTVDNVCLNQPKNTGSCNN